VHLVPELEAAGLPSVWSCKW